MYYGISNEEAPFSNTNSTSHSLVHLNKSVFSSECHLRAAGERENSEYWNNSSTTAHHSQHQHKQSLSPMHSICILPLRDRVKPEACWNSLKAPDYRGLVLEVVHVVRHVHGKRMSHTGQPELGVTVNNTLRLWSLAPPPDVPVSLCPQLHKYK